MAVISIRLNKEEERILKRLADYFHEDRSTLVKRSLFELQENGEGAGVRCLSLLPGISLLTESFHEREVKGDNGVA